MQNSNVNINLKALVGGCDVLVWLLMEIWLVGFGVL